MGPALAPCSWPGDEDVKRAFRVFDSEGLGFIKVTLLKRFLVQAQLGVEDAECECVCVWSVHSAVGSLCVCVCVCVLCVQWRG